MDNYLVTSGGARGGLAHPENLLKRMKQGLVSALKMRWGELSPPGRKFLAPPLLVTKINDLRELTLIRFSQAG